MHLGSINELNWIEFVVYDPSLNKSGSHSQKLWLVNELYEWPIESSFTTKNTTNMLIHTKEQYRNELSTRVAHN